MACSSATEEVAKKAEKSGEKPPAALTLPAQCEGPVGGGGPQWLADGVGYQVWVRAFADADGDGVGDLKGLLQRLDVLNDGKPGGDDLGATILWLSPIFASPSTHGYDTTDHLALAQDIGSKADLKALLSACHARGMKVVLDLVINHVSDKHPWFVHSAQGPKSVKRSWFSWRDDNPGWTQPWSKSPTWHPRNSGWYYGVFWKGMPDLNLANPDVSAAVTDIMQQWLDFGIDGFRLDAARYLVETGGGAGQSDTEQTHAFWKNWRQIVNKRGEAAKDGGPALIGEVWTKTATVRSYLGGDELHSCFDFDATAAVRKGHELRTTAMWRKALCEATGLTTGLLGRFAGNHDMQRLADIAETSGRHKLALATVLALPGTPWIYYGDEVAAKSGSASGDAAWRLPVPWATFEQQRKDPGSTWRWAQALIALRQKHPALRRGPMRVLELQGDAGLDGAVVVLGAKAEVVVAFNFSDDAHVQVPMSAIEARMLALASAAAPIDGRVPPSSVAIWR